MTIKLGSKILFLSKAEFLSHIIYFYSYMYIDIAKLQYFNFFNHINKLVIFNIDKTVKIYISLKRFQFQLKFPLLLT